MTTTTLRRRKTDVYGIVPGAPSFMAFFFGDEGAGMRGWSYRYTGGSQGALVDQQDFPDMGSVGSMAVVSYSPLCIAIKPSGRHPVYLWNVDGSSVVATANHPAAGWSTYGLCAGAGDGYAYWIENQLVFGDALYKLFRINGDGVISQITQASDALGSTLTAPAAGTFVADTYCFLVVGGGSPGILQIPLAGGDQPRFRAGTDWLPGDPTTDWGWTPGGAIPGQGRSLGFALNILTDARLRVSALRAQTGGDPALFASEPLIDPASLRITSAAVNASGSAYSLVIYDGVDAQVAIAPTSEIDESDLVLYPVDPGPGLGYPFLMVPV